MRGFGLVAGFALGGCPGGDRPTLDAPWSEATTTADPSCAGCVEVASLTRGHGGAIAILADPTRDDPRRQWQLCFATFFGCWDGAGDLSACVDQATCPQPCKDAYHDEAAGSDDVLAQIAAYGRVFADVGAPCGDPGPPEGLPL